MAYQHTFGNTNVWQAGWLDDNFNAAGLLGTLPCVVTGSANALILTPYTASNNLPTPPLSAFQAQLEVSGIAASSNTGAATANVAGLGALSIYKDTGSGPAALTGAEIVAGNAFVLIYDGALNSGAGGWHLQSSTSIPAGTVTSVLAGTGLAGGTISTAGTISLASLTNNTLLSNIAGSTAIPTGNGLSAIFDAILSSTQGAFPTRSSLSWIASNETSWSPTIAFGGGSVGVTYGTQVGEFYAVGYLTIALFNVVLTSKGSSTGSATLSLPGAAGGANRTGSMIISNYANLSSVTTVPFGSIAASASVATLQVAGSGIITALLDSNFANNSSLSGMLIYFSG